MSRTTLSEFRAFGEIAEQTRHVLVYRSLAQSLTPHQRDQLGATLRHLAAVREGFQLSLRNGSAAPAEIRDIVRYTLCTLDWSFLEELGLLLQEEERVQRLGIQLMAFAHATIAIATLPHLPTSQVSHPASSHYRDLHSPRRPGEWLERIEELEGVLARIQADVLGRSSAPALRRAHAYFDASAWLVRDHLGRFGCD